jgi:hypothetical protein
MLKKISIVLFFIGLIASPIAMQAQNAPKGDLQEKKSNFSDQEVLQFAEATKVLEKMQKEAEKVMIASIEEAGLDVETYNQIAAAQQGAIVNADPIDTEAMKKYEAANTALEQIQLTVQPKMTEAIQQTGLEIKLFQDMMTAYQQDAAFQLKVKELMEN